MGDDRKSFVEIATFGRWDRVPVEDAVGTTKPVRCTECGQPGRIHKQSANGMRAHFEHHEANPACSLSYRAGGAK
jgi:hypothetical protein